MFASQYITNLLFGASDSYDFPPDEQVFYVGDVVRYTPYRNQQVSYIGKVLRVDVDASEVFLEYFAPVSEASPKALVMTGWRSFDECELIGFEVL
jgi:hypothetical protein